MEPPCSNLGMLGWGVVVAGCLSTSQWILVVIVLWWNLWWIVRVQILGCLVGELWLQVVPGPLNGF